MKIILFDDVCNLCNSTVKFIIKRDSKDIFKFASLESDYGINLKKKFNIRIKEKSTLILVENDSFHIESTAVINIFKELRNYWWIKYFSIIPKTLRDYMYWFISRNRYNLFGKTNKNGSCLIPSEDVKKKFLNSDFKEL
ncbi:DCC1-like thiol-disulfide oxidoreductase family protein [Polaribacter sp. MSW13]|uniref:DCC1-like thiol-disulfide oxidoreductase family protein n=1 Tax=Polaribacter marinus TaxID=2916838 RepID=A0A9X2ANI7_9FLAO|nr:DUF393 domain-containing protein [Polaribacter marinus]MCI2229949.1 DCC1-like thiol-disulfide oxidoreductase family protein [Polaribacter marinus]